MAAAAAALAASGVGGAGSGSGLASQTAQGQSLVPSGLPQPGTGNLIDLGLFLGRLNLEDKLIIPNHVNLVISD